MKVIADKEIAKDKIKHAYFETMSEYCIKWIL